MEATELIAFENKVAAAFESRKIRAPVHLVGGNERQLIEIFKQIKRSDWVLSTWRSHYHALLHGVPAPRVMAEILAGRSMSLHFPEHRFMSSAIMGGMLPIACGIAAGLPKGEHVWCFVGDMAALGGAFHEATQYAQGFYLPVRFIVEDNGLSTNTPSKETWGLHPHFSRLTPGSSWYYYTRTQHHCGTGNYVSF